MKRGLLVLALICLGVIACEERVRVTIRTIAPDSGTTTSTSAR